MNSSRGFYTRVLVFPLEVDAGVDHEPSASGRCRNAAERIEAVDIRRVIAEIRMVQDVDCVNPELEVRCFTMKLKAFDQVHVQWEILAEPDRLAQHVVGHGVAVDEQQEARAVIPRQAESPHAFKVINVICYLIVSYTISNDQCSSQTKTPAVSIFYSSFPDA